MAWTLSQREEMARLKVEVWDEDLRGVGVSLLRERFSATGSGRLLTRVLIRNLVLQASTWVIQGRIAPIDGNLRSLYYQWIKPVVARLPEVQEQSTDPYDVMIDELERFVVRLGWWKYRDLDLVDEGWAGRVIADGRAPHVLLCAEKTGFIRWLKRAASRWGLTAVALGGAPSHLSTEYLAWQLRQAVGEPPALELITVCDHDPSGASISAAFRKQLANNGLTIAHAQELIRPSSFSASELGLFSYPVPSRYPARVGRWLDDGGGIKGEALGIEADAMPRPRLNQLLEQAMA